MATKFLAFILFFGAAFTMQSAAPSGGTTENSDKAGVHAAFNSAFTGFNGVSSGGIIYTVPPGKRLVAENITAFCSTPSTEKVYRAYVHMTNGGGSVSHHLTPTYMGPDAN